MNVLILGGTGTISREIVRQALEKGFDVTVCNRGSRAMPFPDVKTIVADRSDAADFEAKMRRVNADVVIDMICFNERDARQTVSLFGSRVEQIIVTSSIAAYNRPYNSYPICEACETLRTTPEFLYGFNKAEIERYLDSQMGSTHAAITVIRPSLTFGDGTANFGILRQNRNVVRRIAAGKPVVMVGEGVIPWSFTFARDLASAFVLSCGNRSTYNEHFHVTNTEVVMWEDLYRAVGKAVGREPEMCYVSSHLLRAYAPSVCEHLNFEKVHFSVFSVEKFQQAAPAYQPAVTLEQGVRELVDWWERTDFPFDEAKEAQEDQICALYAKFRDDLLRIPRP